MDAAPFTDDQHHHQPHPPVPLVWCGNDFKSHTTQVKHGSPPPRPSPLQRHTGSRRKGRNAALRLMPVAPRRRVRSGCGSGLRRARRAVAGALTPLRAPARLRAPRWRILPRHATARHLRRSAPPPAAWCRPALPERARGARAHGRTGASDGATSPATLTARAAARMPAQGGMSQPHAGYYMYWSLAANAAL